MAYGSGTLFQRGKRGVWYYQAWVDGKQIGPRSAKTTNRKQAQKELDALLGKRARGEILTSHSSYNTVADLLAHYLIYADEKLKSASIIRNVLEAHVIPHLGGLRLGRCDVQALRKYRKMRQAEGADDTTCNRELSYLRAAWRRSLKEGRVSQVPYFPITREDNARKGFLDEPDYLFFLNSLPEYLRGFSVSAYYGGLRRGEILNLDPADIDIPRRFMEVRRTKNDSPRIVPILEGPMLQWLQWSLEHSLPGCLFVRPDGRPVTTRNFYDDWHSAAKLAGVEWFIPHDSRRSASRNLRNEGIPQAVRMKIMGHKTDAMDRRYGIVDLADVNLVRTKMNNRTTAETTAAEKAKAR